MVFRSLVLAFLVLVPGCLEARGGDDGPGTPRPDPAPEPINETWFLKAGYLLSTVAPTKATADRVAATPFANGFANEDIKAFAAPPVPTQRNVTAVRLHVFYEVVGPTADPFPVQGNPQDSRQIVLWLGTDHAYPMSVSTTGPTALLPGRVYEAKAEFTMPPGGWTVPHGERIQLLVATLAVNTQGYELRFLVDSTATPSRIELAGATSRLALPARLNMTAQTFQIAGNGGMFTGATPEQVPSKIRVPVAVSSNWTFLELRVVMRANGGGKSDLDFLVYAPDGTRTLVSSTPYQNETVRAFSPNLAALGAGSYTAEIEAYSGVNTRFDLQTYFASPS
ncbi:MAG: hypothetical protein HYT80_01250 [Euryarchaeota archaeon]|nr:hypothetical protein [Euryarchaeota archaeon]